MNNPAPPDSHSTGPERENLVFPSSIHSLWERVAAAPASRTEEALLDVMAWIVRAIDADNMIWIGGVRVLEGEAARNDPFFGWRLRSRCPLYPEPEAYRQVLAAYYLPEHYGKLTPTYHSRSHEPKIDHVGMTGRASLAGAGQFRVHRLRDPKWIDFRALRKTLHYKLYFEDPGITDRITIGVPVHARCESLFMIHRYRRGEGQPPRRAFTARQAALAGQVVRSLPELHRRLMLGNGLLISSKPLSPTQQVILNRLLDGWSEKAIADSVGQKASTTHDYIKDLYTLFKVGSRAALMALWLRGTPCAESGAR